MVIARARICDLSRLETGTEWRDVSVEAKDFVRGLVCVDPRKRLTVGQAKRHRWLSRHTRELEEVYERAVEGWVKTEKVEGEKNITLEHFNLSQNLRSPPRGSHPASSIASSNANLNFDPYPMGAFSFEPGSSLPSCLGEGRRSGEEGKGNSSPAITDLTSDQFTSQSSQEGRAENGPWRTSELYTAEEDELHDAAAGDGRLRSAMELAREVDARRSERRGAERGGEGMGGDKRVGAGNRSKFFMGQ